MFLPNFKNPRSKVHSKPHVILAVLYIIPQFFSNVNRITQINNSDTVKHGLTRKRTKMEEQTIKVENAGGLDLVWEGIGQDSWDMICRGAQELVAEGNIADIGNAILLVCEKDNKTWAEVEQIVTEFVTQTMPAQMSDAEVMAAQHERASS